MESEKQAPYNEQPPPYEPMPGHGHGQPYPGAGAGGAAPYPQMGFQPTTTQPTMITHTQTIILPLEMGAESRRLTCPHCGADVNTTVVYKDGRMTHIAALLLCLFGFYCCCCIPYCVDSCKDAEHECPSCHRHLGTYRR